MTIDRGINKRQKRELTPLGKEIKLKAIKKGMDLGEVAIAVGMSNNTYLSQIMYGDKKNSKYIPQIAKILDINLKEYQEAV